MKILLVVTHSKGVQRAVSWLAEIARHHHSELLITNCVLNPIAVPGRVDAWPLIEEPQKVRNVLKETVDQLSDDTVKLLPEINGEFPEQVVSDVIQKNQIDGLYFPINAEQSPSTPNMRFGQQLLRNLPCDVVLFDIGQSDEKSLKRVIVPTDLADSRHVIQHLIEHGSSVSTIVPLHISPYFGSDSRKIAETELDILLKEIGLKEDSPEMTPEVVLADGFHQGIMQMVRENDVIVLGGSSVKLIHDLKLQIATLHPQIGKSIVLGVFRPSYLAAKTPAGQFVQRIKAALTELTIADRISLFDRIQGGARLTTDYIAMMALSVLIASLGLQADNASVVIGAMLVAPFMTPLIGIGLALAQGNLTLMKRSAVATGIGFLVGLCLSFVLGLVVPLDELPLEVLSRGNPTLVDLAIAFISGMAAAYAVSRKSVAEAIVGVAIAAALVPPLSCVGIMLGNGYLLEAEGAFTLLITNLAAISLGATFMFRFLGVPGTRTAYRSHLLIRRVGVAMILLVLFLTIPLGFRMAESLAIGQTRPMGFRVSSSVKRIIEDQVKQVDGLDVMFLGRSGSGHSKCS
ncbi:MAG: TIGR00341 family protein [Planctomycetota bacterium]|jgi:uncharacterized hydrophobic protein (TIGR00271 family)